MFDVRDRLVMSDDLRKKIEELLSSERDMTIATIRPDGYPQATTVSFVSEGKSIYFCCGERSQKAKNIAHDNRVSCTINAPYRDWNEIRGLSLGGRAFHIEDKDELSRIESLFVEKFPQILDFGEEPPGGLTFFRVKPEVVSVLDYTKGFGHTDLIMF
jgi:general stress protein 26